MSEATGVDIERMVSEVEAYLARKRTDARHDVYVWSDGRVTPFEPEQGEEEARLVSTFNPGETALSSAEVRESIVRGLAEDADRERATGRQQAPQAAR